MNEAPYLPRGIPPQPTVAWSLRDLIPDELWQKFDIGLADDGQVEVVRRKLMEHGGSDAWLRFIAQTRTALPQILAISLSDTFSPRLAEMNFLPRHVAVICHPTLSISVAGRTLDSRIRLDCLAHFEFHGAGQPRSGDYALADTSIALKHRRAYVIERVTGCYFVPVPAP
jgi:hypothetical protein